MATNSNLQNIRSMVIGTTAEFSFAENAPSAAVSGGVSYPFKDFGNLTVVDVDSSIETEARIISVRGLRRQISNEPTLTKLGFKLKSNEADPQKLGYAFNASITGAFTQSALTATAGQALNFATAAAVIGQWYQLRTSGGVAVRNCTAVTIAAKVEGTDFVLDLLLGRIRFLAAQSASLTPTITCSAVTADPSDLAMTVLNPMQTAIRRGYGRISFFDRDATNKVFLDYVDFNCEVTLEGSGLNSQDGKGAAEVSLMVTVLDVQGSLLVRS